MIHVRKAAEGEGWDLPANATDALVRALFALRTEREGYVVMRTPERPEY